VMPILEFLFGMPVLVFSASAALRCISLVDAPSGWMDQARPGDAAPWFALKSAVRNRGLTERPFVSLTSTGSGANPVAEEAETRGHILGARGCRRRAQLAIGADVGMNVGPNGRSGQLDGSRWPMDGHGLSAGLPPT
jgi:hypothetical protein